MNGTVESWMTEEQRQWIFKMMRTQITFLETTCDPIPSPDSVVFRFDIEKKVGMFLSIEQAKQFTGRSDLFFPLHGRDVWIVLESEASDKSYITTFSALLQAEVVRAEGSA